MGPNIEVAFGRENGRKRARELIDRFGGSGAQKGRQGREQSILQVAGLCTLCTYVCIEVCIAVYVGRGRRTGGCGVETSRQDWGTRRGYNGALRCESVRATEMYI